MKSLFKRVAVGALAAAMLLSTGLTAMARDEMTDMEFVSYHVEADATNKDFGVKVGEIYNEIRDGRLTGKQLVKVVDNSRLEWKFEAYEDVYPYAGYDCLYIDDVKQDNITRYNGLTPQWASKRQDYSWDITRPYEIYERQMTKVNGTTWTWDFGNARFGIADAAVCKPSGRYVTPEVEYVTIGTAVFGLDGTMIFNTDPNTMEYKVKSEMIALYEQFGDDYALDAWKAALEGALSWDSLSARDELNNYVMTDADIQALVPVFKKKLVTAPGERTRDVLAAYLANPEYPVWDEAVADDTIEVFADAEISWTIPQFEVSEPYKEFQFLKINGVALDGTKDANGNVKPVVGRYTGGLANPTVEWKFFKYGDRVDFAGDMIDRNVYEVIEAKYLDGKLVLINGAPVLRVQTDVYGYGYYKAIAGGVEYRIAMADGTNDLKEGEVATFAGEVETVSNVNLAGVNIWVK